MGAIFLPIDHSPNTYTFICVNVGINGMEAHICFVFLPNLHMNRYLVPFSISIIGSSIRAVSMIALTGSVV